jgi:hypothetical protein
MELIPDYAVPLTCCRVTMNGKGEKIGIEREEEGEYVNEVGEVPRTLKGVCGFVTAGGMSQE